MTCREQINMSHGILTILFYFNSNKTVQNKQVRRVILYTNLEHSIYGNNICYIVIKYFNYYLRY